MKMTRLSTGNYEVSFPAKFKITQAIKGAVEGEVKQGTIRAQISQYQPDWSNKALWWSTLEVLNGNGEIVFTEGDSTPTDTLKEAKRHIEILKNKEVIDFYR